MVMPGQVVASWIACLRVLCASIRMSAALLRSASESMWSSPCGTILQRRRLRNQFSPRWNALGSRSAIERELAIDEAEKARQRATEERYVLRDQGQAERDHPEAQ